MSSVIDGNKGLRLREKRLVPTQWVVSPTNTVCRRFVSIGRCVLPIGNPTAWNVIYLQTPSSKGLYMIKAQQKPIESLLYGQVTTNRISKTFNLMWVFQ